MHTCTKLGIAFWDYLGDRLGIIEHAKVPALPDLIRCRGQGPEPCTRVLPRLLVPRGRFCLQGLGAAVL